MIFLSPLKACFVCHSFLTKVFHISMRTLLGACYVAFGTLGHNFWELRFDVLLCSFLGYQLSAVVVCDTVNGCHKNTHERTTNEAYLVFVGIMVYILLVHLVCAAVGFIKDGPVVSLCCVTANGLVVCYCSTKHPQELGLLCQCCGLG